MTALAMILGTFVLFSSLATFSLAASKEVHEIAIGHVVRAPASWLSVMPLGRILSTLGGDLGQVDGDLDTSLRLLLKNIVALIAAVIIIGLMDAWLLLTLAVTVPPSIWMIVRFLPIYRDFRALGACALSHHADHADVLVRARAVSAATELLRGADTHRQFGTLEQAHQRLASHINSASAAYHLPTLSRACVSRHDAADRPAGSPSLSIREWRC